VIKLQILLAVFQVMVR